MIPIKDNVPTDRAPLATVGLIVANVVVYLLAVLHHGGIASGPDLRELTRYGFIPHALTHAPTGHAWATVLTSMFLHASIVQLAGNLWFLWIFGNTLEAAAGRIRFLLLYLAGGALALALETAISPGSLTPTVGAQGAVAAVIAGYAVLFPRARVLCFAVIPLFFTVVEVPVLAMLALWVAVQVVFAATDLTHPAGASSGVAYVASVGGFGFGLLSVRLLARQVPAARIA